MMLRKPYLCYWKARFYSGRASWLDNYFWRYLCLCWLLRREVNLSVYALAFTPYSVCLGSCLLAETAYHGILILIAVIDSSILPVFDVDSDGCNQGNRHTISLSQGGCAPEAEGSNGNTNVTNFRQYIPISLH